MQPLDEIIAEMVRQLEEQGLPVPDDFAEQVAKELAEQEEQDQ
jgi:hypothetical protein